MFTDKGEIYKDNILLMEDSFTDRNFKKWGWGGNAPPERLFQHAPGQHQ